jgi:hypothetical protein
MLLLTQQQRTSRELSLCPSTVARAPTGSDWLRGCWPPNAFDFCRLGCYFQMMESQQYQACVQRLLQRESLALSFVFPFTLGSQATLAYRIYTTEAKKPIPVLVGWSCISLGLSYVMALTFDRLIYLNDMDRRHALYLERNLSPQVHAPVDSRTQESRLNQLKNAEKAWRSQKGLPDVSHEFNGFPFLPQPPREIPTSVGRIGLLVAAALPVLALTHAVLARRTV